ncbi:MAG: LytTR family DNA-binding domain-containing protein [Bacteroidales bacterium]|nr:LytTR family DNA-binding domain-containing protein [Bacteroidales bacterium]
MMRCIAIDDEPLALEVIKKYCSETPLVKIENTFTDAIQALTWLKTQRVDLIFLDIQMPDINGIQFIANLKDPPMVIFTTAFPEYAVKGFELEAIDYLVKPIKPERFFKAIIKAQKAKSVILAPETVEGFLFVKSGYQTVKVLFKDILYIEGQDDYIKIHLSSNSSPILSLMSLKSIMEKLPEKTFMRVHRSFIVPLKNIRSVRNKHIFLEKVKIPIGDTYYESLHQWLSNF